MLSFTSVTSLVLAVTLQVSPPQSASTPQLAQPSSLNGVYRIDIPASDRLYSVVAGASSNLPFAEQQRFFIDLAVRLTPPDLLAIERRGTQISLGSSRAPRMTLIADGVGHSSRASDGHIVRVRFKLERAGENERLVFTSSGRTEDNFDVTFESLDNGSRLRVVRRIAAEGLDQPLIIHTVYNKISDVARWEVYGEPQVASAARSANPPATRATPGESTGDRPEPARVSSTSGPSAAGDLRDALNAWISATNNRKIDQQMTFYAPRLVRFYLKHDAPRSFVREEKARVFATASVIDIRAEEPEIIFQENGVAVMRYRKKYRVKNGRQSRSGEVIQELRWQRTGTDWRIFSERDIKVLSSQ